MSKIKSIGVVVIFLVIITFPVRYNLIRGGSASTPEPKVNMSGECVRDTGWMRKNHMQLLKHTRNEVVREGLREPGVGLEGCKECHKSRGEFCDQCHNYLRVNLECFSCHYYPVDENMDKFRNITLRFHGLK